MQKRHLDQANQIREDHDRKAERIRSRTELTEAAKVGMLAKAYDQASQRMADLEQSSAAETQADISRLHRKAFGSADLPGDPNSLVVSVRDAQDRVERLTSPRDAAALLSRADLSGDEPLARAVAGHAFAQTQSALANPGWAGVVETYAANRPHKTDAINSLAELGGGRLNTQDMFGFVLPKPSELIGVPHGQLQALVNAAPDAA